MSYGLPYDSDEGRALAGAITAIMTGHAYEQSAEIAECHRRRSRAIATPVARMSPNRSRKDNVESMLGVIQLHRDAVEAIQPSAGIQLSERRSPQLLGSRPGTRHEARLSQCPSHRARAHRHHRLPHGLRHHRHRTRHRAGEIQTARRRRHAEDRQSHRAGRLCDALATTPEKSKRIIAHIEKFDTIEDVEEERRKPIQSGLKARASAGVRLRVQAVSRQAQHPLYGAPEDDGRRAAVHQRRDLQDRQHAERMHRRRHPRCLRAGLEDGPEMRGHLSRRLETFAAAQHQEDQRRRRQERRVRDPDSRRASRNSKPKLHKLRA